MWISKTKFDILLKEIQDLNTRVSILEATSLKTYDCSVVLNDGTKVRYNDIKAINSNIAMELAKNMYERTESGNVFCVFANERKE